MIYAHNTHALWAREQIKIGGACGKYRAAGFPLTRWQNRAARQCDFTGKSFDSQ
jgi:hypothetical protein